ncbi:MAG: extracellular solute-binding protein, partial [Acidobacteriaceae bacterium]
MADTQLRMAIREFSDFEDALAEQASLYRKLHPQVSVEIVPLDLNSLRAEMFEKEGLRSGSWDIGFLVTDWLSEAIQDGLLEELTPRLRRNPIPDWPQGWARSIVEPLYFGDKLYSLPWHDGPECLIYRRDLFENPAEQAEFRNRYGYELK